MKVYTQKEVNDLEDLKKDIDTLGYLLITLIVVHCGVILGHIYDNMMLQIAYTLIALITAYLGLSLQRDKKRGDKNENKNN